MFSIAWGLLMIVGGLFNANWEQSVPTNRPAKNPIDDYVSADSCRSCHPSNYASWHASYHRTMTQIATPENIISDMDGMVLSNTERSYRVTREGDKHIVHTKATSAPDTAYANPQEIVLLTGSHNQQICWMSTDAGRTMEQLPFAYLVAEDKWVHMADIFLNPPAPHDDLYTKGDWNKGCMNCHVTQGRQRFVGDGEFDSEVSDFGISCEACHSGGREHIALNRDPLRRFTLHLSDKSDQTIANPARMDGPTASLVCGQCHSVWTYNSGADHKEFAQKNGKYRPGMSELDLRWVVEPQNETKTQKQEALLEEDPEFLLRRAWGDGMIRANGREYNGTIASPCFKGGEFSCFSCHEMHPDKTDPATLHAWAEDQMGPQMKTNQACLQCHENFATNLSAHTNHAIGSSGSSCQNCHMPYTTLGLMKAVRSHQISSPNAHESLAYGRPNACSLCHLDQPLAWAAEKMHDWYGHDIPAMNQDDRELSAGAKWILKGDASQRTLMVSSMGWQPAQQASGYDWFYPYLAFALNDPYAVTRFRAWKSLQSLPGFADFKYDYTVGDSVQKVDSARAYQQWWHQQRDPYKTYRWQTILRPSGDFRQETYERLLSERDNSPIFLVE